MGFFCGGWFKGGNTSKHSLVTWAEFVIFFFFSSLSVLSRFSITRNVCLGWRVGGSGERPCSLKIK